MGGRTVQVRVGGHCYRVVTSATDDELHRATSMVEKKLAEVAPPGRMVNPHALLLAALALANELEELQAKHNQLVSDTRSAFVKLRDRIDATLGNAENAKDEAQR